MSAHHKTVLRRKLVDSSAQQSLTQSNGAFGQVIAKTAREFDLSLGLIRRQSQRVRSTDLHAVFSQYAIFSHAMSTEGNQIFLCLDPILASALIEVQTISFVSGTSCVDRSPSVTDRALIAPFLDQLAHQGALSDVLPKTKTRPHIEEGADAMEIHLKTGVYRVVQGTFRLQGSDLKMQIALGVKEMAAKSAKPKQPAETHPQMFDVRAEFDAVLFKRSMTLNELSTLSEGDLFKFPTSSLKQVMLCPKGTDEGPVGYLGKANGMFAVSFPAENIVEAKDTSPSHIPALDHKLEDNLEEDDIDQYLSDIDVISEASGGPEPDGSEPAELT